MFIELPDGLSTYLLPVLIAVPLALLVCFVSRRQEPEPEPARPPAPPPAPPQPAALLIVDDSAVARAKLSRLFDAAGYRTTLARDGVEALERLAEQRFQVMVTDLEMPNKDGFELIAAVQGALETENLPIIAITGHDELQARVHQIQGVYGIFKKPWNDRELLKRVESLVHLRSAASKRGRRVSDLRAPPSA